MGCCRAKPGFLVPTTRVWVAGEGVASPVEANKQLRSSLCGRPRPMDAPRGHLKVFMSIGREQACEQTSPTSAARKTRCGHASSPSLRAFAELTRRANE